ncbi:hypothetical protein MUO14_24115 [Halobacillus shinanisalinarum]|uniref:Phage protein n=1 Tax=Halobacillus shinanisalinarum TaxID=2932258 RepID=A0ABY4GYZ2_9BACI|nr:hypothetical protein [Halobacillus shinanisalinarum]UOQ93416.1 hypothetical protein MUO14_24115 [Halobacillus shinanisalinarum]
MEIVLKINGEDKTFTQSFVSGYCFKKALELSTEEEKKGFDVKILEKEIDFVCEVFNNQFTRDEFYKGVDATKLMSEIRRIMGEEILGLPSEDEITDFLTQQAENEKGA